MMVISERTAKRFKLLSPNWGAIILLLSAKALLRVGQITRKGEINRSTVFRKEPVRRMSDYRVTRLHIDLHGFRTYPVEVVTGAASQLVL